MLALSLSKGRLRDFFEGIPQVYSGLGVAGVRRGRQDRLVRQRCPSPFSFPPGVFCVVAREQVLIAAEGRAGLVGQPTAGRRASHLVLKTPRQRMSGRTCHHRRQHVGEAQK